MEVIKMTKQICKKEETKKSSGRKGRFGSRAKQATFWNVTRVNNNLTLKEVSELIGVPESTCGRYFAGLAVPPENTVDKLCELFDVDRIQGMREFINANKKWDIIRGTEKDHDAIRSEKISSTDELISNIVKQIVDDTNEVDDMCVRTCDIRRLIYGKVDYDVFLKITGHNVKTFGKDFILDTLYGVVDKETYLEVVKIMATE